MTSGSTISFKSPASWLIPAYLAAFIIVESLYLLLAGIALYSNIPLHISHGRQAISKGAIVVITIIWQALATYPIRELTTRVFSAEWHYQFNQMDRTLDEDTDKVSTLDSGIMDYTSHFFSKNASWTFRVAAVVALILRALAGIAPAAISVSVIPTQIDLALHIANLTAQSEDIAVDYYDGSNPFITSRAASVIQVEQLDNKVFGYNISQSYIIPTLTDVVPNLNSGMLNLTQYRTDVVQFDFSCQWMVPDNFTELTISMAGIDWTGYNSPALGVSVPLSSGIFPLIPYSPSPDNRSPDLYPVNTTSLSAYLFAQNDSNDGLTLDGSISTIPSEAFIESVFWGINNNSVFSTGAFLVCDPHPTLGSASIHLLPDGQLEVDLDNGGSVGNIPQNVSNVIFSTAMLDAISQQTLQTHIFLTNIAYSLFIADQQVDADAVSLSIKSLSEINKSLNAFFLSASKAFADGYRPQLLKTLSGSGSNAPPTILYSNMSVPATQQLNSVLGLTGTHLAFYATIVLVTLAAILASFLYRGWKQERGYPFSIDSMVMEGLIKKSA